MFPSALGGRLDVTSMNECAGKDMDPRDLDDEAADPNETPEERQERRMRRNRMSAAISRTRKRQYVQELEAQVASLHDMVRSLKNQNVELRQHFGGPGAPPLPPLPPPVQLPPPPSVRAGRDSPLHSADVSLEEELTMLSDDAIPTEFLDQLDDPLAPSADTIGTSPLGRRPSADTVGTSPLGSKAGVKRGGSLLTGGGAKRLSAAGLAFMSAVTFVTLTVNSDTSTYANPAPAHPGSRMLMSLTGGAPRTSLPYSTEPADASAMWPSLFREAAAPALDTQDHLSSSLTQLLRASQSAATPQPLADAERVTRAPHNSSWMDVLRIEAAERQLAEAQLALRQLRLAGEMATTLAARPCAAARPCTAAGAAQDDEGTGTALSDHAKALAVPGSMPGSGEMAKAAGALRAVMEKLEQGMPKQASAVPRMSAHSNGTRGPVYEPVEEEEDFETASATYEAQRYVFCSRAYMFDAAVRHSPSSGVGRTSPELPRSMPPRFRHAAAYRDAPPRDAQRLPDGRLPMLAGGNESSPALPVVNLLLPSATLQGVPGAPPSSSAPNGGNSDLMQVQCQVLNVSRFTTSVPTRDAA